MADSRTRRKPSSGSRSISHTRSPSRVDPDDTNVVFELRKEPTDRGKFLTRKNMRHVGSVLGMASQPFTTLYRGLDTGYGIWYDKEAEKGPKKNQVATPLPTATAQQIPEEVDAVLPVLPVQRRSIINRNGGKKKRRKTRKRKK